MKYINPFAEAPSMPTRPERREKLEVPAGGPERLYLIEDLRAYLATPKEHEKPFERTERENACENIYSCDPWKYEPFLLNDLLQARIAGSEEAIRLLRGIIRAGSWSTHMRRKQDEILQNLDTLLKQHGPQPDHKMQSADPETSDTQEQAFEKKIQSIKDIIANIQTEATGEPLERSVRTIEDMLMDAWNKIQLHHIARGEVPRRATATSLTEPLYRQIELIRPIRDFLYFRRLYPILATTPARTEKTVYTKARQNIEPPPMKKQRPTGGSL